MLSCRDVAEIVPTDDWSFGMKLKLHAHLLICTRCRALQRQFKVLDQQLARLVAQRPVLNQELAKRLADAYLKG